MPFNAFTAFCKIWSSNSKSLTQFGTLMTSYRSLLEWKFLNLSNLANGSTLGRFGWTFSTSLETPGSGQPRKRFKIEVFQNIKHSDREVYTPWFHCMMWDSILSKCLGGFGASTATTCSLSSLSSLLLFSPSSSACKRSVKDVPLEGHYLPKAFQGDLRPKSQWQISVRGIGLIG